MTKKPLALGVEVHDMHYSWHPLKDRYEINDMVSWLSSATREFTDFIETSVGSRYRYTNKLLVVISDQTDFDDFWTAAWCYDGHRCGVLKLKEKA